MYLSLSVPPPCTLPVRGFLNEIAANYSHYDFGAAVAAAVARKLIVVYI